MWLGIWVICVYDVNKVLYSIKVHFYSHTSPQATWHKCRLLSSCISSLLLGPCIIVNFILWPVSLLILYHGLCYCWWYTIPCFIGSLPRDTQVLFFSIHRNMKELAKYIHYIFLKFQKLCNIRKGHTEIQIHVYVTLAMIQLKLFHIRQYCRFDAFKLTFILLLVHRIQLPIE